MQNLASLLLVEDDDVTAEMMQIFLAECAKVDRAATAEEAIEMARHKRYEMGLIDIHLGGGPTGITVLQALREMAPYVQTPFIAVTAYAMVGDKEKFLSAGFDDYISKPYRKEELLDKVSLHIPGSPC